MPKLLTRVVMSVICYKPEMYSTRGGCVQKKREPQIHIFRELFRKHGVATSLEIRESSKEAEDMFTKTLKTVIISHNIHKEIYISTVKCKYFSSSKNYKLFIWV